MTRLSVEKIIVPLEGELALEPSVRPENKITEALKVMLKNDLKQIVVSKKGTVLGMIRLEDALKQVGLDGGLKTKEPKSVVIHGRKIVVEE
jgi:predicted transcriptional regulator